MTRNGQQPFLALVGGLAVLAVLVTGCSKGVERSADVASGDYYTADEFEKLSKEQRDAYCDQLSSGRSVWPDVFLR